MKELLYIVIISLLISCNNPIEALNYNNKVIDYDINGPTRDMFIEGDSLYVVSEEDGVIIYTINTN